MTHEVIKIEARDASKVHILTGIITDIGDGVVDVNIDDYGVVSDIPVFYHCPESETADGMPFSKDDRVIIVNSGSAVSPSIANMKVIGFEDGLPRECGFKFKLTRGDEILITEVSGLLTYIKLYNSSGVSLSTTEPTYTPVPATGEDTDGYWSFNLSNSANADPNGYWVNYSCGDGILTQYPYKYKKDDKNKNADLISIGVYEDIIPYWNVKFVYDPEPVYISPHPRCIDDPFVIATRSSSRWWLTKTGFSMNRIVKSSIPFKVVYEVKSHYGAQRTGETCQPTQQAKYTAISADGLLNFDFVFPVTPCCIESGWINGNKAGFDAKIIITITGFAEDYNCSDMWLAYGPVRPWEIYVRYEDFDPLPC